MQKINSNIQIKEWTKTPEGFLRIPVVVISEEVLDYPEFGTQEYVGPDIYREEFLRQIEGYPFVWEHPSENGKPVDVNSENYKRYIKGSLLNPEAQPDKKRTVAELMVYDKDTVEAIESGDIKELSAKYESVDVKENGTFGGKKYNVKQTNMILNHLALTEAGRAGDKVKVLISKQNSIRSNTMEEKDKPEEKKENELPPGGESPEHEQQEELTLESLSKRVDKLLDLVTQMVDGKKPEAEKANEDTAGGTIDKDEIGEKRNSQPVGNSLTAKDVESIIAENNEIMQMGKSVVGNDIYAIAQKCNSSMDAIMRTVLVKSGEYTAESVKKLNSIDLKAEYRSVTKYAAKLNSMKTNSAPVYEEQSGGDFFNDARFMTV